MNEEKLSRARHSLSHLLGAAVLELYPGAKNAIGPAIATGFYYDFDLPSPVSDSALPKIEKKMRELAKDWEIFSEMEVSANEALKVFEKNKYKQELIEELRNKREKITLYYSGPRDSVPSKDDLLQAKSYKLKAGFLDLCRGGHADSIKDILPDSWKLFRLAGAYWRGHEKNKMLTRIYGLAFSSKKELEEHEKQMAEAEKRDHKKLGRELDLFLFSELVGAGLPLWTPKGTLIRDLLDDYVWELRQAKGYRRVTIPHLTKKELYEKSGHWQKFRNELFIIKSREGHTFALKPMNCPHHIEIFRRKLWSYRELPERYASTTMVYRDEQTGELSGITRTRSFTQDDAHVFCRMTQIEKEFGNIWDIVQTFYRTFGFELKVRLSSHDPKQMEKYLGTEEGWRKSESILENIARQKNTKFEEAVGEAAYYGPKIDFLGIDSLRREWQVATIQLDINQPERFDLHCVNEKGEKERIALIHAAIMGSIERFLSIYIEHTGGAFPLWLAPVQVAVLPVSEKQSAYAEKVSLTLKEAGIRAELDISNETLGKKVRQTKLAKIPYWLVIGEKEAAAKTAAIESRDRGSLGAKTIEEVKKLLLKETKERRQ
ncbi:MAG: threonine--tRNA ligase [Candidatus Taylorbacteria bacterium]|nr:threonine--tRNA ligase [Candidatus Taylorbacteria bacterium]